MLGRSIWLFTSTLVSLATSLAVSRAASGPAFYKGFDLSSLKILEDGGAVFKDSQDGDATKPVEDILKDFNTVRLRLWVDPNVPYDDGYYETYNLEYVMELAQRFYSKGYYIYLDFHFSDYWADPNQQYQPEAWPRELEPLSDTLRKYVSSTMQSFSDAGVDLSIVSLGNEIRNGMLWPLGQASIDIEPESARIADFTNLATLYAAAREGVRDAVANGVQSPQVMIHIDNGWDASLQEKWFGALTGTGKVSTEDWDLFGFSMYPFYGTEATFANLQNSLNTIAAAYNKPVHIVETDWPSECSGSDAAELSEASVAVSAQGQIDWLHQIVDIVKQVPGGLGQGVNYWEPAWLNNTGLGSSCQSAILFDADWSEYPKVTAYSLDSVSMFEGV